MSEKINDIVKLAIDAHHGSVQNYSVEQSMEALRAALIEANNGKTYLDYRAIRDGKCVGLFTILEEIIARTAIDGLQASDWFNTLVDYRNIALGDKNSFVVEDSDLFMVADVARGTQSIRRQRIGGYRSVSIETVRRGVRIYEELDRVLSGQVDFNHFIDLVGESYAQKMRSDIYNLWASATYEDFGGQEYFPTAGAYDEDELLDVIGHVEAAAGGKTATIIGTKKAIRNLVPSIIADSAKEDLYNMGYFGKFYGSPVMAMPQRHQLGSTSFVYPDNVLTIVAGDNKPIKFVREGDPLILNKDPEDQADLTMEYSYYETYGLGIVVDGNSGIGRYEISND